MFPIHDISNGACSCREAGCTSPGKHPRTPKGFHDATRDPVTIAAWWRAHPYANIGIDCGRSGLAVADVDVKKGAQGEATLRWFLERSPAFSQTYMVATPTGGYHFYFSGATPNGGTGKLGPGIDLQSVGRYVLAPPSVAFGTYDENKKPVPGSAQPYRIVRQANILPFPTELIPGAPVDDEINFEAREFEGPEREVIPYGEHRQALLWLGWHLRSVQGLSVESGLPLMRDFLKALDRYNPSAPFSDRDLRGMLTRVRPNIASTPPPTANVPLVDSVVPAATILAMPPPVRQHFVTGLILQGELHVFYGEPGVGKSTIAAYEMALISKQGHDILTFISEDRPYDFATTFHLSGGDLTKLTFQRSDVRQLLLPKATPELEQLIASRPWGAIYFDSILDMRSMDVRLDAANAARALFGPLSELAQRYNVSIICTAHTNKQGVIEGAKQITAKARVVAKIERPKAGTLVGKDSIDFATDPTWTVLATTEKFQRGRKGARYAFYCETKESLNPYTGKIDREIDEHGSEQNVMQYICTRHERLPDAEEENTPPPVDSDLRARIEEELRKDPTLSGNKMKDRVHGRSADVYRIMRELKGEK